MTVDGQTGFEVIVILPSLQSWADNIILVVLLLRTFLIKQVSGIALPEEERLKGRPNLSVFPMLAENVTRVELSRQMEEGTNLRCDGFAHSME